jgi:hypothetical protein
MQHLHLGKPLFVKYRNDIETSQIIKSIQIQFLYYPNRHVILEFRQQSA